MSWRQRFKKQLTQERQNARGLLYGASIFFLGMGLVYFSEHFVPSSLQQELIALGGIVFIALGASFAATAYLLILLNRLGIFDHDH